MVGSVVFCLVVFCKQETAYDMRMSDWSSDVCSSDLYPGRLGYWAVGVPPSGPMDSRALRLGNRLLGNEEGFAALEITMSGHLLRFNCDAVEHGRASCRERVCQYVEISVVDVSLQQNTETIYLPNFCKQYTLPT